MRAFRWLCAVAMLAWAPVALAHAHAHLEKSVPPDGSVLTAAPRNLVLTFAQPVRLTALWLQKDGGTRQTLGPLPKESAAEISIPVPALGAGSYVASWRVVSDDGHIMPGSLAFRITGPAAISPAR